LKVGYSFWGFLGDYKFDKNGQTISAPDGNSTYSWSIIHELQKRHHLVYLMQENRDAPAHFRFGTNFKENFAAFAQEKRLSAYNACFQTAGRSLPELDLLLVEWRFPIHGVNCKIDGEGRISFSGENLNPDLKRQEEILSHYKQKKTKIIFFDLDHKLTKEEEEYWKPDAVFETSVLPRLLSKERVKVNIPYVIEDLSEHPTEASDPNRKLVYIGSRYERDDVITKWIGPVSEKFKQQVEFHGDWLRTVDECRKLWPHISYHGRCTTKDFKQIYGTASACPLLAKKSYLANGFITARLWETILFGTLPIGLGDCIGIDKYVNFEAKSPEHMIEIAEQISTFSLKQRHEERMKMIDKLHFMDVKYFIDELLEHS